MKIRKMAWALLVLGGVVPAVFLSACATIMQGTTQQVSISSSPTGAKVTIDQREFGSTPVIADLKRKDNHVVQITMDGYEPYQVSLSRGVSGWVAGNIVFGGIIGLAVDAITGGMYKLTPEQITATLANGDVANTSDQLVLTVVLTPDPSWEQIGQLVPAN